MYPDGIAMSPDQPAISPKKALVLSPISRQLCAGRFSNKAHSQKQIFMQSLICNVNPDAQLLHCFEEHTQLQSHGKQHAPRRAATCQANVGPSPCPALDAFIASSCNQVHILIHSALEQTPLYICSIQKAEMGALRAHLESRMNAGTFPVYKRVASLY